MTGPEYLLGIDNVQGDRVAVVCLQASPALIPVCLWRRTGPISRLQEWLEQLEPASLSAATTHVASALYAWPPLTPLRLYYPYELLEWDFGPGPYRRAEALARQLFRDACAAPYAERLRAELADLERDLHRARFYAEHLLSYCSLSCDSLPF